MGVTSATNRIAHKQSAEPAAGPPSKKLGRRTITSLGVIVPVYNEQYLVSASLSRLAALGESSLLDRIQVVVIDDGSSDQTAVAIENFRASLSV